MGCVRTHDLVQESGEDPQDFEECHSDQCRANAADKSNVRFRLGGDRAPSVFVSISTVNRKAARTDLQRIGTSEDSNAWHRHHTTERAAKPDPEVNGAEPAQVHFGDSLRCRQRA